MEDRTQTEYKVHEGGTRVSIITNPVVALRIFQLLADDYNKVTDHHVNAQDDDIKGICYLEQLYHEISEGFLRLKEKLQKELYG